MGSLKPLVEPECAQPNALVRYAGHVTNDPKLAGQLIPFTGQSTSNQPHQQMVDEYMMDIQKQTAAPASFSMHALLHEIGGVRQRNNVQNNSNASDWLAQYTQHNQGVEKMASDWSNEFQPITLEQAWGESHNQASSMKGANLWSSEYLSNAETSLKQQETRADNWTEQFLGQPGNLSNSQEAFWDSMENKWDDASATGQHEWMREYEQYNAYNKVLQEYSFASDNPYSGMSDVLRKGKEFLSEGNLAQAILCFEEAVKVGKENPEAWHLLGMTQAENEQESQAISALKECLALDPAHLQARFLLAVAYTNENMYNDACNELLMWLQYNERFKQFVTMDLKRTPMAQARLFSSSFIDRDFFNRTEQCFLQAAANQSGSDIDASLQNAIGVLYNISGNYERAVDSFKTALSINPQDARIWNRLGATLANSSQSADAVGAYSKALDLYPGFVRARYNLGISCLNLNSNREAMDHFASALTLQQEGLGPTSKVSMSESIWNIMRVAAIGSASLIEAIDKRDLSQVNSLIHGSQASLNTMPS